MSARFEDIPIPVSRIPGMIEFWISAIRMGVTQKEGRSGGDERKIEWRLSEVNTSSVSREQNELIGEFKISNLLT